jgi:hypothetical protein
MGAPEEERFLHQPLAKGYHLKRRHRNGLSPMRQSLEP